MITSMAEASGISRKLARGVLAMSFPKIVIDRYLVLSEKAQLGTLSSAEETELDGYLSADAHLSGLQSNARVLLKTLDAAY